MASQAQRRRWRDAVEATPTARDWAERSGRPRLEVRRGIPAAADRARPLEFDARGFPIAQPTPSFVWRVARLLDDEQAK